MKIWKDRKKYYIDNNNAANKSKKKYFFTKNMKHQMIIMASSVFAVFLVMFGASYAIFSSVNKTKDFNGVNVGDLHITYKDESGAISLTDTYPISDEEGLKTKAYSFSIQNTGSLATTYSVKLLDDKAVIDGEAKVDDELQNKLLSKEDLKVSVNGSTPVILETLSINDYEIINGTLQPGESKKIAVQVWIKEDASNDIFIRNEDGSLSGKYYYGKITVEGENTKTYETDSLLVWNDAINNTEEGHGNSDIWYDLSGNNNPLLLNSITDYSWKDRALNLNLSEVNNINLVYDISNLDTYTVSVSFTLLSNEGSVNIIDASDMNVYLEDGKLRFGNDTEVYPLDMNKLYTVTITKSKNLVLQKDNSRKEEYIKTAYINGEVYKDITDLTKTDISGGNINIDLHNYLVYAKGLTLNKENNNYLLTKNRYGE